ncbi:hypothetical protein DFH08DRAFT_1041477 [Mycena albidolilacea]|uniref:Uncharacterized protein n=1 Tax=Mycena albidolilacea TaxID=1033008 RepID=A0AAD7ED79_9AGAR|nr:hypothetical protein DFH08DRAFT_1041477 [Mycena albidolilacea]
METMEGHPVITLHDKAADVEVFLKAIFDSRMPPPAEIQFEDALAILRLSHKYDVGYLRRRALQHLGPIYPTTLAGYDARAGKNKLSPATFIRHTSTLTTAVEVGALWLLPVVYYGMCRYDLAQILVPDSSWRALGDHGRTTSLLGHSTQITQFPKIISFLCVSAAAGEVCENWINCNRLRMSVNLNITRNMKRAEMRAPLDMEICWARMKNFGLCSNCLVEARSLHAVATQDLWDRLPQMFGLPGWENLEELKGEALAV